MVDRHNHLLYHFSITIRLHLASFYAAKYLKKKLLYLGKTLIEQNIEFEWRGPGPPGRTCTPITVNFTTNKKSLTNIFEWIRPIVARQ